MFFPLVSDEVRQGISVGSEDSDLAGAVMVEAFLLRLCLKFFSGISKEELQKDMQNWAVQPMTGFRNCCFFNMLLRVLLEPSLPVTTLLVSMSMLFDLFIFTKLSGLQAIKSNVSILYHPRSYPFFLMCLFHSLAGHLAVKQYELSKCQIKCVGIFSPASPHLLCVCGRAWCETLVCGEHITLATGRLILEFFSSLIEHVLLLQTSEDEVLFLKVLYDVLILVEYPFLKSQLWTQLPGDYLKNLALTWLLIADIAIQFVRESCDQTRALSYIDAFSKSCLPNQLIKWVTDQTGVEEKISRPNVTTPKALIRWLLVLEDQGVRVFDHNILKLHAKAVICKLKVDCDLSECKPDYQTSNDSVFLYNESNARGQNKVDEDQEMVDLLDDAFPADCMIHSTETERKKKRKEGRTDGGETRFKLAKFNYDEILLERCFCFVVMIISMVGMRLKSRPWFEYWE